MIPPEMAEAVMLHAPLTALGSVVRPADDCLVALVGPPGPVKREVVVYLSTPALVDGAVQVAVSWEARSGTSLFPRFRGALLVGADDHGSTVVELLGDYDPPAGALGAVIDDLFLHGVASDTAREFVRAVAGSLERACSPAQGS